MSCFLSIKGLLRTSMLDWPGRICSVVFLGGCNFRCPYCHNPELVEIEDPLDVISWKTVRGYLWERRGWIDGVSVTGGEPTLHSDLKVLCREIKELGMKVKLDTNGSRPRALEELLEEGMLDSVAMDVKTTPDKYPDLVRREVDKNDIRKSIELIVGCGLEQEFRCTVVPGLVDFNDLKQIAGTVEGARSLVLQQFRSDITLDPMYAGVKSFSDDTLRDWAECLSRWVPTTVRGTVGVSQR
ncbi:MAG: anaerobic ribonucleoside-triphosphate reductase activating protein [Actinomycetota bacterium]|nr:anaerobic ribonucleoside-triphosphate reductase activating protein [Actinomycetota bacterium]